jgi:hypothetical protein
VERTHRQPMFLKEQRTLLLCILNFVYVFLFLSMYFYCSSMYSYLCLCILTVVHVFLDAATLTEVFPCFFLCCKANAPWHLPYNRGKLAKMGHSLHSSNCCVVLCIVCFVSFYVLFVCECVLLPPGDNPIAVNKYIISSYHINVMAYKTLYSACAHSFKSTYTVSMLNFIIFTTILYFNGL